MTDRERFLVLEAERRAEQDCDNVKWFALLLRQGFLLIVGGIEKRYGLTRAEHKDDYGKMTAK
jgi:hypothetical protein